MKKLYIVLSILATLVSGCSQNELLENQSATLGLPKVTAGFEQNQSRTYVEEGTLLRWTKNDQISLFLGNDVNLQYQFDGETGEKAGTFSPMSSSTGTGSVLTANYAIYPYDSNAAISEDGVIAAKLPDLQSYAENSFGLGVNTMVAITQDADDTFFNFKNVCGYLKLKLYGDNVTVKSITLRGNNNEKIAGNVTITPTFNGAPSISMANDATKSITLDCGENGITIGSTVDNATAFWFVVPPITFENGFTVSFINENDEMINKSTSNKIVVERNVIESMESIELEYEGWFNPNQYITYVENHETIYPNEDDWYEYSSYFSCPISKISKIEYKYEMKEFANTIYLSCRNRARDNTSAIYLSDNGLTFDYDEYDDDENDSYSDYSYTWNELNVGKTDCMTLTVSFRDSYIKLNGVELVYKMLAYTSFSSSYLFTYYYSENDEGLYRRLGEGVPEGSKLYYVKIWDENDNLVYLGAASKALNRKTNQEEYCWRSCYDGEYHYEFAYNSNTLSDYQPYGGGID